MRSNFKQDHVLICIYLTDGKLKLAQGKGNLR